MSVVGMFDEYRKRVREMLAYNCTEEFLMFVEQAEKNNIKWGESENECIRLREQLELANRTITDLERKLSLSRYHVDEEKKKTKRAEIEKNNLKDQITKIEEVLKDVQRMGSNLANETKSRIDDFLTHTNLRKSDFRLNTIDERDSTAWPSRLTASTSASASLLSIDCTQDDDDDDSSRSDRCNESRRWSRSRRSLSPSKHTPPTKRRRSSRIHMIQEEKTPRATEHHVVTKTTVTVPDRGGGISASATIERIATVPRMNYLPSAPLLPSSSSCESIPAPAVSPQCFYTDNNKVFKRPHGFINKYIIKPTEECDVCFKKSKFGNKILRCGNCKLQCHAECKENIVVPCIPAIETPRYAHEFTLADYCSKSRPMVPQLVAYCIMEIEARGMSEVGIYRVPGSEREVKALKERFLRGRGAWNLSQYDIHVLCGTLKDFFRSLSEPLVTFALWKDFAAAIDSDDQNQTAAALYQIIGQLPQPNRDTLAYLMQHLQKVSSSSECKMNKSNLAIMFGPSIVGFSSPKPNDMLQETGTQVRIVESLLNLPFDYWYSFIAEQDERLFPTESTPVPRCTRNRSQRRMFT